MEETVAREPIPLLVSKLVHYYKAVFSSEFMLKHIQAWNTFPGYIHGNKIIIISMVMFEKANLYLLPLDSSASSNMDVSRNGLGVRTGMLECWEQTDTLKTSLLILIYLETGCVVKDIEDMINSIVGKEICRLKMSWKLLTN